MGIWDTIKNFFAPGTIPAYILDTYFVFIIVLFICFIAFRNRHMLAILLPLFLVILFSFLANQFDLKASKYIFNAACLALPTWIIIVLAPDIHNFLDSNSAVSQSMKVVKGSDNDKKEIADAVMHLSSKKTGALITIEKNKLLDQYSEKAIVLDAEISKELLINIFEPNTPLHDGAVIIKGNKIRCAGAYYVLSTSEMFDKTVGSRHRAALGIAEVTDSVTIVVSEETGKISITYSGIIISISDRDKLLEYLDLAMD